jgi:thiamine kinase-like enzyme
MRTIAQTIAGLLDVDVDMIADVRPLKKGMTNDSFHFAHDGVRYLFRKPGAGTEQLIDRFQEYAAYQAVSGLDLCEDIVYLDPQTGYKISVYHPDARVCDPHDPRDVKRCMAVLRRFHDSRVSVAHTFDLFDKALYYEGLLDGPSVYEDHAHTKSHILELKHHIDAMSPAHVLTHIDAVPDNFLFVDIMGTDKIRLIDWEYAGMQDPHVDIAMFAIYALYEASQIESLIDTYFKSACPAAVRTKIYAYIAVCGYLWSNWCEYKRQLGVDFGDYALRQYQYAKDYYRVFQQSLDHDRKTGESRD